MRFHFIVALCWLCLANWAIGQQPLEPKAFAEFPPRSQQYLQRLHGKQAAAAPGELAFRDDFPGGFAAWQRAARKQLTALLGIDQIRRAARGHQPTVALGEPIVEAGYTRQLGRMETEPGVKIPFWLLRPQRKASSPTPLVICAHGHDADGWNTYAGVYRDDQHRSKTLAKDGDPAVQAVRRGYIAIAPATRGLAAVTQIPDLKNRHGNRPCRAQLIHCLLAGRTAVGERVWDSQRILDWAVADLDGVDPQRIAFLGNSGGGVLTVYMAALDERISVAVPSCSFTSYTSRTGFVFHCDCCLVPGAQPLLGDMADIGALAAPRPLLAVHGRKDGLHSFADVERAMARVATIYRAAKAADRFGHRWGSEGHKFYPKLMWPFIEAELAK